MRTLTGIALSCLCLALGTVDGSAQSRSDALVNTAGERADRPLPGGRMRIHTGAGRLAGMLVAWEADAVTVRLDRDGSDLTIPLHTVHRLEMVHGTRPATGRGALIGGVSAGGTGLVLGLIAMSQNEGGDDWANYSGGDVVLATVVLGAVGTGVGALVGSLMRTERWENVRLAPLAGARLGPVPGGGFTASLSIPTFGKGPSADAATRARR